MSTLLHQKCLKNNKIIWSPSNSGSLDDDQSFSTSLSNFTAPAQYHNTSQAYRFQKLIIGKARQGVKVKIIVWQPKLPLRILPGASERGLDGRADEVEVLNELAREYKIEQNLIVKIDNTSPTLSSVHHEKIIVIDNTTGFCGGFDLSRGKWDTICTSTTTHFVIKNLNHGMMSIV